MAEITTINGTHAETEGDKKRKSHPSPLPEGPGSVALTTEPKRAKTADILENNPLQKNTEVTQVEFNDTLANILRVAQGLDKLNILGTVIPPNVNGETAEASIATIRSKLGEAQYTNVFAFKDDIAKICQYAITANAQAPEKQEYAQKLLQLVSSLVSDKSHYTIRSHGKKVRSREESQAAAPERSGKVALFQRGPEGFVFSSRADIKEDSIEPDVAKTVIVPTASAVIPPTLNEINTKPRPMPPLSDQAKKKTTGVEYCKYTPFTSFAPFIDSSNAELNAEDTDIAYDAILTRYANKMSRASKETEEQKAAKTQLASILDIAKQYQDQDKVAELNESNLAFLSEDGLDVKNLLQIVQASKADQETLSPVESIQKNATLLYELYKMQEERFNSKDQTIGAREMEIAATLRNSLLTMANQIAPSTLITPEAIEDAMRRIPYKDPSFVGTLPATKPFAFPSNSIRNGLPPTATGYPVHNPVGHKRPLPPTTIIPSVSVSPHINMTGGYPNVPQPSHHAYAISQQPTHQKTYSRPRSMTTTTTTLSTSAPAAPLRVSANGDVTFKKNFHTLVTVSGGTPSHWRRNDSQIPCANCGTLVSPIWRLGVRNEKLCNACGQYNKKWNGQHRPVSLFPNTITPTFRK
ncbi:Bromodomain containing protein 7 [Linnemannia zychae]|nr:Bromodomain containing protein 7 [Linnemannia zychae]